ncbi:hypothetical protein [Lacrimispora sp.]|uniref:hypothetical protein n=1 Tax=Lacrimispora sp. TaxID=2719234 RepID=UPI0028A25CFF|nr:hypothetical protein [Lacrimispora sp.]
MDIRQCTDTVLTAECTPRVVSLPLQVFFGEAAGEQETPTPKAVGEVTVVQVAPALNEAVGEAVV